MDIKQIEKELAALPRYSELAHDSLEFRLCVLFIAMLHQPAKFWDLQKLTKYPDQVISIAIKKLEDNDCLRGDRAVASFVRSRVKGADELNDRILREATTSANVSESQTVVIKPGGKVAAIQRAIASLLEKDEPFSAHDVAKLCTQEGAVVSKANISNELWIQAGKNLIACVRDGGGGRVNMYAKPGAPKMPTEKKTLRPAQVKTPTASDQIRDAIIATGQRVNGTGFTWDHVAEQLRSQGLTEVGQYRDLYRAVAAKMAKDGKLMVIERGVKGGVPTPNVYALANQSVTSPAAAITQSIAPIVVDEVAELDIAAPEKPEVEWLPGPESPHSPTLKDLHYLHAKLVSDVEALNRVIGLLERM